jgi:protein-S-isoprenylcysteine O-methyltransferase Ste14
LRGQIHASPARARDLAARVATCGLFLALTWRIAEDVARTGRVTGLLLLASEFLVVVLTLVRRPALDLNATWHARAVLVVSVVGPALARPDVSAALLPDLLTGCVSGLGLLVVIGGKLSLGRSFGLLAANRGLVSRGFYRAVRHPIYGGYLITHVAFVAANATPWNLVVLGAADVGLILRALTEERTLFRDPHYVSYAMNVRWRMVPGVF